MPTNRKWLLLPPAVALLLVLGPLSMQSGAAAVQPAVPADAKAAPPAVQTPSATVSPALGRIADERQAPALPRTPDLWQVGSTLIGVLLLGGVGVLVLRRLRQGPSSSGTGTIALRQTLRLSPKQAVHAIEFDGRMLLVGESERGVQLLHASGTSDAVDENIVARRGAPEPEDDGAVPKDLVLPRPPVRAAASAPAGAAPGARRAPLGDFRALLAKAGR